MDFELPKINDEIEYDDVPENFVISDILSKHKVIRGGTYVNEQDCNGGYLTEGLENIIVIDSKTNMLMCVRITTMVCTDTYPYRSCGLLIESRSVDSSLLVDVFDVYGDEILPSAFKLSHFFKQLSIFNKIKRIIVNGKGWHVIETDNFTFLQSFELCNIYAVNKKVHGSYVNNYEKLIDKLKHYDDNIMEWSEHVDGSLMDICDTDCPAFSYDNNVCKCECKKIEPDDEDDENGFYAEFKELRKFYLHKS